jgi:hypothetical protein
VDGVTRSNVFEDNAKPACVGLYLPCSLVDLNIVVGSFDSFMSLITMFEVNDHMNHFVVTPFKMDSLEWISYPFDVT